MAKAERVIAARQAAAARYNDLLAGSTLRPPSVFPASRHIYQSYVALLPAEAAIHRAKLINEWRAQEIEATIGTVHIPLTTFYSSRYGYAKGNFPVTDDIAARSVTLPLYEGIGQVEQDKVVRVVCASLD
jgi:dTDP-4-amino-4,6-dideoxygalactose transaminase